MEPTDEYSEKFGPLRFKEIATMHILDEHHILLKSIKLYSIVPTMIRVRGAGFERLHDKEYSNIPKLTQMNFKWNGLPMPFFQERIMYILDMGLGSVLQKDYSLLANVQNRDAGAPGPLAPVGLGAAVATPQIASDRASRNERSFCCILNYIDPNSMVYKMYIEQFRFTGPFVYAHMKHYGPMPTPPRLLMTMESAWNVMTMESAKIPKSANGILRWSELVLMQGKRLKKSPVEMKEKFLSGLPGFMESIVETWRKDTTMVHPAMYGPGYPAYLRLVVHPHAGLPDVMAIARAMYNTWMMKLLESGRLSHGLIYSTTINEDEPFDVSDIPVDDIANLTIDQIKDSTICHECGGKGHATTQFHGETKIVCPTKQLRLMRSNAGSAGTSADGSSSLISTKDRDYRKKSVRFQSKYNKAKQLITALMNREKARATSDTEDEFSIPADSEAEHTSAETNDNDDNESVSEAVDDDLFNSLAESGFLTRERKPSLKKRK